MAGTIVVDRLESDASYASSINVASPLVISNTISVTNGTITGNLNIDNGTLFVNQNNNRVGIGGITNPADFLDVNTSISITENSVANSNTFLTLFSRFSDSQRGYVFLKAESNSSGSSDLVIRSRNNFSEAEKFRIDSVGRVTQPFQPAFCVFGISFSGTDFLGTTVTTNTGSHFNVSNGRFTAPIAGTYMFSFCLSTEDTNNHFVEIALNGSNIANRQLTYGVAFQSGTQFVIVSMSAGDYVIAKRRDTGYAVYNCVFSGYLLG